MFVHQCTVYSEIKARFILFAKDIYCVYRPESVSAPNLFMTLFLLRLLTLKNLSTYPLLYGELKT